MSEPCDLSATEARRLIGTKALSPVELMDSCLARIDAVNGAVNAIVAIDHDAARRAAEACEDLVMRGGPLGALHGLPLAVKDNQDVDGLRTTFGSLIYRDHVPAGDGPGIARLRAAGALPFAKTNLPEFGAGANTKNRLFGATKNPFDLERTPAGSSGGSAVALATGMAPLATGSDYGGSLRTPASFCGVVGFRPSLGLVPHTTGTLLSPFGVSGPMGRTVMDAYTLLQVEAAHDPRDVFSSPGDPLAALHTADLAATRVAFSEDLGGAPVASDIRALFSQRANTLAPLLAHAEWATPDFGPRIHDVFEVTRGVAFLAAHQDHIARHRDVMDINVLDNCDRALAFTAADVAWAQREQSMLYRRALTFFETVDVLIAPAASVSPFPHDELFVQEIDGEEMPTYMRWLALSYMPTLAFCCAACIPAGRDKDGLPFGLQVIGPAHRDQLVLSVAAALEAALAGEEMTARPVPDLTALAKAAGGTR